MAATVARIRAPNSLAANHRNESARIHGMKRVYVCIYIYLDSYDDSLFKCRELVYEGL